MVKKTSGVAALLQPKKDSLSGESWDEGSMDSEREDGLREYRERGGAAIGRGGQHRGAGTRTEKAKGAYQGLF